MLHRSGRIRNEASPGMLSGAFVCLGLTALALGGTIVSAPFHILLFQPGEGITKLGVCGECPRPLGRAGRKAPSKFRLGGGFRLPGA